MIYQYGIRGRLKQNDEPKYRICASQEISPYFLLMCIVLCYMEVRFDQVKKKIIWSDKREIMPRWLDGYAIFDQQILFLLLKVWIDCNWIQESEFSE